MNQSIILEMFFFNKQVDQMNHINPHFFLNPLLPIFLELVFFVLTTHQL